MRSGPISFVVQREFTSKGENQHQWYADDENRQSCTVCKYILHQLYITRWPQASRRPELMPFLRIRCRVGFLSEKIWNRPTLPFFRCVQNDPRQLKKSPRHATPLWRGKQWTFYSETIMPQPAGASSGLSQSQSTQTDALWISRLFASSTTPLPMPWTTIQ